MECGGGAGCGGDGVTSGVCAEECGVEGGVSRGVWTR